MKKNNKTGSVSFDVLGINITFIPKQVTEEELKENRANHIKDTTMWCVSGLFTLIMLGGLS